MYDYRLPIDEIRTIEVTRDLQSISQIDHRTVFPLPMPIVQADGSRIDFSNDAPRKFYAGHVIIITGIPYGSAKGWFAVNFTEGPAGKHALSFNPRFHPDNVVVRNAMNDDLRYD